MFAFTTHEYTSELSTLAYHCQVNTFSIFYQPIPCTLCWNSSCSI